MDERNTRAYGVCVEANVHRWAGSGGGDKQQDAQINSGGETCGRSSRFFFFCNEEQPPTFDVWNTHSQQHTSSAMGRGEITKAAPLVEQNCENIRL